MNNRLTALLGVGILALGQMAQAQDYDDIYYDGSESPKPVEKVITTPVRTSQPTTVSVSTTPRRYRIPVNTGSSAARSDDEYNRRGAWSRDAMVDTLASDSSHMKDGKFANTERIERFHNPNVVKGSGDEELITLYYDTTPTVNIIIGSTVPTFVWGWRVYDPWFDPWFDPWYGPHWGWGWRWGWHRPWYDPWFDPWYGPGWAWHRPCWDPWYRPWCPGGGRYWDRPFYASGNGRRPGGSQFGGGGYDVGGGRRPGYSGTTASGIGSRRPAGSGSYGPGGNRGYGSTDVSGGRRPGYASRGNVGNVNGSSTAGRRPSSSVSSEGYNRSTPGYGRAQTSSRSSYDGYSSRSYDRSSSSSSWGGSRGGFSGGHSGGGFSSGHGGGGFSGGGGRRR